MAARTVTRGLSRWGLVACSVAFALVASSASAQAQPETPTSTTRAIGLLLQAGGGVTQRTLDLPSTQGRLTFNSGWAPALDLRVSGRISDERHFLRVRVGYQSSIGWAAVDRSRIASTGTASTPVRSLRLEGGIAPGLWLGAGPGSTALSLFVGYGLRALGSETELRIPRFTLHGPLSRLELEIPLVPKLLSLRLAPEAQLIVSMTQDLARAGQLDKIGVAYGGEADLHLRVTSRIACRVSYRESHALVMAGTAVDAHFIDIERYLVGDILISY